MCATNQETSQKEKPWTNSFQKTAQGYDINNDKNTECRKSDFCQEKFQPNEVKPIIAVQYEADKADMVSIASSCTSKETMKHVPLSQVLMDIKGGRWSKAIEKIRQTGDKKQRTHLKKQLPLFVPGIVEGDRCDKNTECATHIVYDYDGVPDIEFTKRKAMELPMVMAALRSPSNGVKVCCKLDGVIYPDVYKAVWLSLRNICDTHLGITSDPTSDISHGVFVSYDPKLLWKEDFTPHPLEGFLPQPEPETLCPPALALNKVGKQSDNTYQPSPIPPVLEAKLLSAMNHLATAKLSHIDWTRLGLAIKGHFGEVGKKYWDITLGNPNFPEDTQESHDYKWRSFDNRQLKLGTVFFIAEKHHWSWKPDTATGSACSEAYLIRIDRLLNKSQNTDLFRNFKTLSMDTGKLPACLREYLETTDKITDSQHSAKVTALLPAIAVNIGNKVYINNRDRRIYPNIWGLIIGQSSVSRKTSAMNLARKTLEPFDKSLLDWDGADPESLKNYQTQTLLLTGVTSAKLAQMMALNPNRCFIQGEMSGFIKDMGKQYNAGMKELITDLYDGKHRPNLTMERVEIIKDPALSIMAASTEDLFTELLSSKGQQGSGFVQRMLVSVIGDVEIDSLDTDYRDAEDDMEILTMYEEIYQVFRSIPGSFKLALSKEAIALYDEAQKPSLKYAQSLGNDAFYQYHSRIYGGYVFKFCIIITLMESCDILKKAIADDNVAEYFMAQIVTAQVMEQALYLAGYYFENTIPLLSIMDDKGNLVKEKKFVDLLDKKYGGEAMHSDIQTDGHFKAWMIKDIVETLTGMGVLEVETLPSSTGKLMTIYTLTELYYKRAGRR